MKNNLFYYATSELSQDAFICWLASFALKESHSDPALKECAEKLIRMFVPELCNQKFILTNVERQFKHVDVLLTVEATHGIYKIIVEDKTYTSEHGNQLKDYLDSIKQAFPSSNVRGVYYKTGFQCNLSAVFDAGYVVITREQMLKLLSEYAPKTKNRIFLDYYEFWAEYQRETQLFHTLDVAEWNSKQVNGFYDFLNTTNYLTKRNFWMNYGYVPNKNGGFEGLWTGVNNHQFNINGISCELYLQLEATFHEETSLKLHLRISSTTTDKQALREARNQIIYDEKGI